MGKGRMAGMLTKGEIDKENIVALSAGVKS
jgi:hypothetical protein